MAIINSATINMGMKVSLFFEVTFAVVAFFSFEETSKPFSIVVGLIYIINNSVIKGPCPAPSSIAFIVLFFLSSMRLNHKAVLTCVSLMANDVDHNFKHATRVSFYYY